MFTKFNYSTLCLHISSVLLRQIFKLEKSKHGTQCLCITNHLVKLKYVHSIALHGKTLQPAPSQIYKLDT